MTEKIIAHKERVTAIQKDCTDQRVATYRSMMHMAETYDSRGDVTLARQARQEAAEYADTRLGEAGRRILGL